MSAYPYPLLIKQLLHTPLANAPHQQIVYRTGCATTTAPCAHVLRVWAVR